MSLVCATYTYDKGWVLLKNRDRRYKPYTRVRKSFRNSIERLYVWDEQSRYTEGINEFGVSIISSIFTTEVKKRDDPDLEEKKRFYFSPEGLRIRTALFELDSFNAVKKLTELEIPGNTIVCDSNDCYILEGAYTKDKYIWKVKKLNKDVFVVRTNYSLFFPYSYNVSSTLRRDNICDKLKKKINFENFINICSRIDRREPLISPVKMPVFPKDVRTTGQIVLVPSDKTLYYRSIWENISYDIEKLNNRSNFTYFELLSNRDFLLQKEQE